ncbi:MAG TPA: PTS sugar transporter subunit IIA [Spirochaetota bacterium]|mgnify:CR=1 FL=1|jgi:mannitol/fructose-specific phosphotransferase system IIA component (Ntr-type)|nr:PTS sugar transporter subunit IIA [Spirochaetota bacterium]OPZ39127.1 MAG: PTS system fructose-specific EIIABC component [Spirochaetes bacterium ADurb.BinA120]HNU92757.1 PTS sugar transporter subunit IIA [Spirochaetota bacterium]HPI12983.1 PTS sugar transporter subunit IIA [Spirochaetota bacterium]HPO45583.1 PTS sugar transporter subunit IIA [Spirochaetota bacterium]
MEKLSEYTNEKFIKRLRARNKYKAIEELARLFDGAQVCSDIDELVTALVEREKIMSTGIGFGLAIPHAKIKSVKDIAFSIGISRAGIDFDSMDGKPVNLIILVAAGDRQHKDYLTLLSRIMSILKDEKRRAEIINAAGPGEIMEILSVE